MSLGDFLSKIITAPLRIVAMPLNTLIDVMDSDGDVADVVKAATNSIEKQVKDIID